MSGFRKWLQRFENDDTLYGVIAREILADPNTATLKTHSNWVTYFRRNWRANDAFMAVFEDSWESYLRQYWLSRIGE